MFLRHNPHSFLTGDAPFLPTETIEETAERVEESLTFALRHEGFVGIPHGGLAMGLCLDAWRRIGEPSYPVNVRFKFGGSGILIGDTASFTVERGAQGEQPSVVARLTKNGDKTPYLRAEITAAAGVGELSTIPEQVSEEGRPLPYYRNCFVCGHHRTVVGLQRRFRVHDFNGSAIVTTPWGYDDDDKDRAAFFLIGKDELHPAALVSIFDENTAWGGFMLTRAAGLSVRLDLTLLRPVGRHEKLLFVGRPTGTRGNPRAPRFFLAEGTVLSMVDPQRPEPVAHGRGEWVIMDLYTNQIKKNLLPEDDWTWIFGDGND
jgi:hypothetical protein